MRSTYIFLLSLLVASPSLWAQATAANEEKSSLFLYGVNLSTEYDDQILPSDRTTAAGDVIYSVQPQLGFTIKRSRWQSTLNYFPAITYSVHRRSQYDLISHSLGFTLQRRFTKRLTFDVQNNYTLTNNPFDSVRATNELQPFGPLDQPNNTLVGTVLSRRMEQVGTTLTYALSRRSTFGVSGNFMYSDYRQNVASGFDAMRRSVSESGDGFYKYQLGPRASMGFRYRFQRIDFEHAAIVTDSHSLLYSWDMAFKPRLLLSLLAGPNYSDTRTKVPDFLIVEGSTKQWSGVGGAILTWYSQKHDFTIGATRQVSDGGGTRGNVLLDSYNLKFGRQLSRRLSMSTFAMYNRNHPLIVLAGSPSRFDYLTGGAEFSRVITEHTAVGLFYMRVQQDADQTLGGSVSGNRVGIRLSYHNERPLGR